MSVSSAKQGMHAQARIVSCVGKDNADECPGKTVAEKSFLRPNSLELSGMPRLHDRIVPE